MDELLGPPPGSRTFDNEWQLLAARLGGDWATCMGLALPPPVTLSLSPIALNLLTTFGLPISDLHFTFSYFILISSTWAPLSALNYSQIIKMNPHFSPLHISIGRHYSIIFYFWLNLKYLRKTGETVEPPSWICYATGTNGNAFLGTGASLTMIWHMNYLWW